MSTDLDLATLDHWFGWMRDSESWRREREIVYGMWTEIERLRTALVADDEGRVAYQNGFHARDAEVESLRKELEREKQEHDRCTTFHAIAVKERNYERVLALQRDAEIKRLHGEMELMRLMDEPTLSAIEKRDNEIERLREVIRDLDAHEGAEGWSQDLRQRVRKALGE